MDAKIWKEEIPFHEILDSFYSGEDTSTGTVVIHAGRVKLPGKVDPDMSHVTLEPVNDYPGEGLSRTAQQAMERFPINRVQVHHRLGTVLPGENLLIVLVSAGKRGPAFDACRWIVDEIKREEIIRLTELRQDNK